MSSKKIRLCSAFDTLALEAQVEQNAELTKRRIAERQAGARASARQSLQKSMAGPSPSLLECMVDGLDAPPSVNELTKFISSKNLKSVPQVEKQLTSCKKSAAGVQPGTEHLMRQHIAMLQAVLDAVRTGRISLGSSFNQQAAAASQHQQHVGTQGGPDGAVVARSAEWLQNANMNQRQAVSHEPEVHLGGNSQLPSWFKSTPSHQQTQQAHMAQSAPPQQRKMCGAAAGDHRTSGNKSGCGSRGRALAGAGRNSLSGAGAAQGQNGTAGSSRLGSLHVDNFYGTPHSAPQPRRARQPPDETGSGLWGDEDLRTNCTSCEQRLPLDSLRPSPIKLDERQGDMCRRCWEQLCGTAWPKTRRPLAADAKPMAGKGGGRRTAAARGAGAVGASGAADQRQGKLQTTVRRRAGAGGSRKEDEDYQPPGGRAQPAATRRSSRLSPDGDADEPVNLLDSSDDEAGGDGAQAGGGNDWSKPAPRRSTRHNIYQAPSERFKGCSAVYPKGAPDGVEVKGSDMARLEPDEFLNDTVIDLYIRYIQESLPPEVRARCHFFNSFFFKKLTEKQARGSGSSASSILGSPQPNAKRGGFDRVRKWTKGVDVFAKDWLFVPVHDHLHWSLAVIAHPGVLAADGDGTKEQCILHLDSLHGGHNTTTITKELRGYLQHEWARLVAEGPADCRPKVWAAAHPEAPLLDFTPQSIPGGSVPSLPKQDNYCDCGLFLLAFMEFFTYSPPTGIVKSRLDQIPATHEYRGFLHKHWFSSGNASALRGHLRALILDLFIEQGMERAAALTAEGKEADANLAQIGVAAAQDALLENVEAEDRAGATYLSPEKYREQAAENWAAHLKAVEERRAKMVQDKLKKQEQKEESEKAKRDKRAAAAEKRAQQKQAGARRASQSGSQEVIALDGTDDQTPVAASSSEDDEALLNADQPREVRSVRRSKRAKRASSSSQGADIEIDLDGSEPATPAASPPPDAAVGEYASGDEAAERLSRRQLARKRRSKNFTVESDDEASQLERPKRQRSGVGRAAAGRTTAQDGGPSIASGSAFDALLAEPSEAERDPRQGQADEDGGSDVDIENSLSCQSISSSDDDEVPVGRLTHPDLAKEIEAAAMGTATAAADLDVEDDSRSSGGGDPEQQPQSLVEEAAHAIAESDEDGANSPAASRSHSAATAEQPSQEHHSVLLDRMHPLFRASDPASAAAADSAEADGGPEFWQQEGFVGDTAAAGNQQEDAADTESAESEESDRTQPNLGPAYTEAAEDEQTSPPAPAAAEPAAQEPAVQPAADGAAADAKTAAQQDAAAAAAAADAPSGSRKPKLRLPQLPARPERANGKLSAGAALAAGHAARNSPRKVKQPRQQLATPSPRPPFDAAQPDVPAQQHSGETEQRKGFFGPQVVSSRQVQRQQAPLDVRAADAADAAEAAAVEAATPIADLAAIASGGGGQAGGQAGGNVSVRADGRNRKQRKQQVPTKKLSHCQQATAQQQTAQPSHSAVSLSGGDSKPNPGPAADADRFDAAGEAETPPLSQQAQARFRRKQQNSSAAVAGQPSDAPSAQANGVAEEAAGDGAAEAEDWPDGDAAVPPPANGVKGRKKGGGGRKRKSASASSGQGLSLQLTPSPPDAADEQEDQQQSQQQPEKLQQSGGRQRQKLQHQPPSADAAAIDLLSDENSGGVSNSGKAAAPKRKKKQQLSVFAQADSEAARQLEADARLAKQLQEDQDKQSAWDVKASDAAGDAKGTAAASVTSPKRGSGKGGKGRKRSAGAAAEPLSPRKSAASGGGGPLGRGLGSPKMCDVKSLMGSGAEPVQA